MIRKLFTAGAAGTLLALALATAPASATPETDSIPLATLADGPTSGTLANGAGFSVNVGGWSGAQGYAFYQATSPQIWTFDQPVSVRFGVAGLNIAGECFTLPVDAVLESLSVTHTWDPSTHMVCRATTDAGAESVFTIAGPVTELTLLATGSSPSGGRGPTFIDVTYETPDAAADSYTTVQDEPVTFEPAANDSADVVAESVRLLDGGTPVTTLTNADGTYIVNTSNGEVTFTPAPGFVGTAASVAYRILGTSGLSADSTFTVTVGPIVGVSMFNGPVALGALGVLALLGGGFAVRRRLIASN